MPSPEVKVEKLCISHLCLKEMQISLLLFGQFCCTVKKCLGILYKQPERKVLEDHIEEYKILNKMKTEYQSQKDGDAVNIKQH